MEALEVKDTYKSFWVCMHFFHIKIKTIIRPLRQFANYFT